MRVIEKAVFSSTSVYNYMNEVEIAPHLLIELMQPEVESLLHVLPSIVESELDAVAPRHNGDKLTTHALSLKGLDGNHLRVTKSERRREGRREGGEERERKW